MIGKLVTIAIAIMFMAIMVIGGMKTADTLTEDDTILLIEEAHDVPPNATMSLSSFGFACPAGNTWGGTGQVSLCVLFVPPMNASTPLMHAVLKPSGAEADLCIRDEVLIYNFYSLGEGIWASEELGFPLLSTHGTNGEACILRTGVKTVEVELCLELDGVRTEGFVDPMNNHHFYVDNWDKCYKTTVAVGT